MKTQDYGVALVRPALPEDADLLAPKLRPADLLEIEVYNKQPLDALKTGVTTSSKAYAIETPQDGVVALFGVAKGGSPEFGSVWLLASPSIEKIKLTFLRHSAAWLSELARGFRVLGNFVDERNELHIHWLRWLGFHFLRRITVPEKGTALLEFAKLT